MKFLPRVHGWPKAIEPLALFAKDQPLKAHTAYVRAKAGDEAAGEAITALHAYHGDITAVWEKILGDHHNHALLEAGVLLVDHE